MIARIPPKTVSRDDKETLRNLDRDLKTMVFGQDNAIDALVVGDQARPRGLREPEKPIGSYLFSGPTGVGKTEVARQLAARSASSSPASTCRSTWSGTRVSRLIGAPPGYVGFDQGGLLDRRRRPASASRSCCSTRSRRRIPICSTSCCR